jgi:hypothetical protein
MRVPPDYTFVISLKGGRPRFRWAKQQKPALLRVYPIPGTLGTSKCICTAMSCSEWRSPSLFSQLQRISNENCDSKSARLAVAAHV